MKMNLLETYDSLLQDWRPVFSQERTFQRARRLTFGLLVCLRLHLTSRAICAVGRQFVDWSADYRLCSRSPWNPHRLYDPIFDRLPALLASPSAPVIAALDDTLCKKTGRHIPGVSMARDPMSPPFHVNLCYGLRFVQLSLLVSPAQSLLSTGFQRTADYLPLPKWRRHAARPSLLDLLNLLRSQLFARGVSAPLVTFDDFASAATPPELKSSKLPLVAETLATLAA